MVMRKIYDMGNISDRNQLGKDTHSLRLVKSTYEVRATWNDPNKNETNKGIFIIVDVGCNGKGAIYETIERLGFKKVERGDLQK